MISPIHPSIAVLSPSMLLLLLPTCRRPTHQTQKGFEEENNRTKEIESEENKNHRSAGCLSLPRFPLKTEKRNPARQIRCPL